MTGTETTNLHKATPDGGIGPHGGQRCQGCGQTINHLPAGQGWVHEDGHVLGYNEAPAPPVGLALLPHLTEAELTVLLGAVDSHRMWLMADSLGDHGDEIRVLWSLSTAVSEAIMAAHLDARWRALT